MIPGRDLVKFLNVCGLFTDIFPKEDIARNMAVSGGMYITLSSSQGPISVRTNIQYKET